MSPLRFLLPFFGRYRGQLIAGVVSIFLAVVIGLATPLLVGQAVDTLKQQLAPRTLLVYGLWVVGIAAVRGVFLFAQRRLLVAMSRNIEQDLRDLYFRHLTTLTPAYFSHHPTGDLMARATNDLSAVRMVSGPAIMYASNTVFTSLGGLSLMCWIHPRLTLASLAILPFVALVTKVIGARIHVLFERVQENFSALTSRVQENLAGVRVVRAYAQEEGEEQRFDALNREAFERNRRLARWNAAFDPLLQALVGLGFVAVLWYGGFLVQRGELSVGGFVTFNLFLSKLIWPMIAIGYVSNLVQRGSASLARIREVLSAVPEIVECPEPRLPAGGAIRGQVTVRGLIFRYAASVPPAVRGVSFEVPAGARVALVGRTGAGKSTLLQLLPRAYDPPPGTVFVDGVDVLELPLAALRAAIGVVPQESFLFSATVAENIAFGRPEATVEEITAAAAAAGLEADLAGFPRGLDTLVGERGITLSGGQKQRVALARALVRQPRILLLDDSLSAVDTHTEELILGNLERHFRGRTVFLVSHRISTVRGADLILVLDGGQVVERGSHDELLALGGLYADLHERQQLEAELEEVE